MYISLARWVVVKVGFMNWNVKFRNHRVNSFKFQMDWNLIKSTFKYFWQKWCVLVWVLYWDKDCMQDGAFRKCSYYLLYTSIISSNLCFVVVFKWFIVFLLILRLKYYKINIKNLPFNRFIYHFVLFLSFSVSFLSTLDKLIIDYRSKC